MVSWSFQNFVLKDGTLGGLAPLKCDVFYFFIWCLQGFTIENAFIETDDALQAVIYWPKIGSDHFASKLKFTIAHTIFRNKVWKYAKTIDDFLKLNVTLNDELLDYVIYSIHDSDISNFYHWIIGYLRAVDYAGKGGMLTLQYLTWNNSSLPKKKYAQFLKYDIQGKQYLH